MSKLKDLQTTTLDHESGTTGGFVWFSYLILVLGGRNGTTSTSTVQCSAQVDRRLPGIGENQILLLILGVVVL